MHRLYTHTHTRARARRTHTHTDSILPVLSRDIGEDDTPGNNREFVELRFLIHKRKMGSN